MLLLRRRDAPCRVCDRGLELVEDDAALRLMGKTCCAGLSPIITGVGYMRAIFEKRCRVLLAGEIVRRSRATDRAICRMIIRRRESAAGVRSKSEYEACAGGGILPIARQERCQGLRLAVFTGLSAAVLPGDLTHLARPDGCTDGFVFLKDCHVLRSPAAIEDRRIRSAVDVEDDPSAGLRGRCDRG